MWKGTTKKGKEVVLLNPYEKGQKFYHERMTGQRFTNTGKPKFNVYTGEALLLDCCGKSYRAGYYQAQKDANKAFLSKHPRYKSRKQQVWKPGK